MNHFSPNTNSIRQSLIEAAEWRIAAEIDALTMELPHQIQRAIRDEVLAEARYQLRRLATESLMSEVLIERHVTRAAATATYLIERYRGGTMQTPAITFPVEKICQMCDGAGEVDLWDGEKCDACSGTGVRTV